MPSESYAAADTERSWEIYERLALRYPDAIVIGGWGTWLHVKAEKSHDIDLIVTFADMARLRSELEVTESSHIGGRKWRSTFDGIHLDLYVPHQSELGDKLKMPVEALAPHVAAIDGHRTLSKEALIVAKSAARLDRPDTLPGKKDAVDMARIVLEASGEWDWAQVGVIADASKSAAKPGRFWVAEALASALEAQETKDLRRRLSQIIQPAIKQLTDPS